MNLIPKTSLWGLRAVQALRLCTMGSSGPIHLGSGEPIPCKSPDKSKPALVSSARHTEESSKSSTTKANPIRNSNLWVLKSVQVERRSTNECCGSGECLEPNSLAAPGPSTFCDAKQSGYSNMTTIDHKLNRPEPILMPSTDALAADCVPAYTEEKTKKAVTRIPVIVDKDIIEYLKCYFDDQITYHRKMVKINKVAMKRIKKLKKSWPEIYN